MQNGAVVKTESHLGHRPSPSVPQVAFNPTAKVMSLLQKWLHSEVDLFSYMPKKEVRQVRFPTVCCAPAHNSSHSMATCNMLSHLGWGVFSDAKVC